MSIKKKLLITTLSLATLSVWAVETFQFIATNNKDLESKMEFLDKLSTCDKHKYHADGSGDFQIFGKVNNVCKVNWSIVECNFPEGIYQKFAKVQKEKTLQRYDNRLAGYFIEIEDSNYHYLFNTGNLYCKNRY